MIVMTSSYINVILIFLFRRCDGLLGQVFLISFFLPLIGNFNLEFICDTLPTCRMNLVTYVVMLDLKN
jgi:hypothetical protein